MSATTLRPEIRTALSDLIDYAGLFPPARLAMRPALDEYARAYAGGSAWMLGRFILPLSRFNEAVAALEPSGLQLPLPVSAIVDADAEPRRWFASTSQSLAEVARLRDDGRTLDVAALEIPLPPPASARETYDAPVAQLGAMLDREGLRDLPVYVEVPRGAADAERDAGAMRALARARLRAKVRCGGLTPEAFPSPLQLAGFVSTACDEGVAFKATAGLHHPIRHQDVERGVKMHGFVNLLAAAIFAGRVDGPVLEAIISEEDPSAFALDGGGFAWRTHRVALEVVRAARVQRFVGYGSCSFSEPVEDLTELGWLHARELPAT